MKQTSFLVLLVMFGYSQVQAIHHRLNQTSSFMSGGSLPKNWQSNEVKRVLVQRAFVIALLPTQQETPEMQKDREKLEALLQIAYQALKAEQKAQQRNKNNALFQENNQKTFVQKPNPKCNKQVRSDTPANRQRNRGSHRTSTPKGH
jgi:hypothetical protein